MVAPQYVKYNHAIKAAYVMDIFSHLKMVLVQLNVEMDYLEFLNNVMTITRIVMTVAPQLVKLKPAIKAAYVMDTFSHFIMVFAQLNVETDCFEDFKNVMIIIQITMTVVLQFVKFRLVIKIVHVMVGSNQKEMIDVCQYVEMVL